ncbi:MAG: hypothetical protein A3D95_13850 [Betaproteobacteria bacterium RIFCSPHIGHO2_12_FULL_69_13]|nr:MAG: hypothetical protein A3D95_13850 [Betaproteobacteria bacterium RIFCSPHIGHO2_12_FULL_69_13]OGA66588.1 MAG: hypothetical protein A3G83_09280 [Betaproteobacteria bacterium RIFCSPLOWO2_12_FULL_68_20]
MLIAAAAVILLSGAGIAAMMGWIPTTSGDPGQGAVPPASQKPAPAAALPRAAPAQVASRVPARTVCSVCGVVESVREVERPGESSGAGVVAGGVAGAVVGRQFGEGRTRDAATVLGAVGGAVAGDMIEKRVKTSKSYEITIRFEDGSTRVLTEANPPAWRPGDRVRVVDGQVRPNA